MGAKLNIGLLGMGVVGKVVCHVGRAKEAIFGTHRSQ